MECLEQLHMYQTRECKFPSTVHVVFDNKKVGEKLRKLNSTSSSLPQDSTPIEPQEDTVTNSGGVR